MFKIYHEPTNSEIIKFLSFIDVRVSAERNNCKPKAQLRYQNDLAFHSLFSQKWHKHKCLIDLIFTYEINILMGLLISKCTYPTIVRRRLCTYSHLFLAILKRLKSPFEQKKKNKTMHLHHNIVYFLHSTP